MVTVYILKKNRKMIVERIKKIVEKYKNKIIIIRGGWNARIGEKGENDEVNNEDEEILKLIGKIGVIF